MHGPLFHFNPPFSNPKHQVAEEQLISALLNLWVLSYDNSGSFKWGSKLYGMHFIFVGHISWAINIIHLGFLYCILPIKSRNGNELKIKYAPCHPFPTFTFGSLCSLATISLSFWPLSQLGLHYLQKKIHIFPHHRAGMNQQLLCTNHHKKWAPYFSIQIIHQAGTVGCWQQINIAPPPDSHRHLFAGLPMHGLRFCENPYRIAQNNHHCSWVFSLPTQSGFHKKKSHQDNWDQNS